MSLSPKAPERRTDNGPMPMVAPQPLALPDQGSAMGLSQLRIGNRNGLKMAAPTSGLRVPAA